MLTCTSTVEHASHVLPTVVEEGRPGPHSCQSRWVGAPFERIGVDILEMPLTFYGNRYTVVFMDYVPDQVG